MPPSKFSPVPTTYPLKIDFRISMLECEGHYFKDQEGCYGIAGSIDRSKNEEVVLRVLEAFRVRGAFGQSEGA